ncbi:MAG: DinB family protein [Dehalococcoidia bacterium]|nr:DinB family protein [Dehalococcoidia bacterium]
MDSLSALRTLVKSSQTQLSTIMADVTPEQAMFLPPGTANSILMTYRHIVEVVDRFLNKSILGKETIWESERWGEKLQTDEQMRMVRENADKIGVNLSDYHTYAERVFAAANAYMDSLTEAELAREIQGFRGPTTVGAMIATALISHSFTHIGEIAAIKGFQGLKGLP